MPRDKDLKRLVRARMKKTGEAYTAARANILRKPARPKSTPPRAASGAPPAASTNLAELAGMSDAVIKEKTGCTWERWVYALDRHGADTLPHREIAALVSTKYKVGPWWSQMVTVGYERIKGLRARGQRRDGTFEASKSRTFDVPVAVLFDAWSDAGARRRWLAEPNVRVRTASAPKSMRLAWSDGRIVSAWFTAKGTAKSSVAVSHPKLPDRDSANRLKHYWAEKLDALAEHLARADASRTRRGPAKRAG